MGILRTKERSYMFYIQSLNLLSLAKGLYGSSKGRKQVKIKFNPKSLIS